MSHTVTVTRTTTTSSTSVFLINVGYLKKIPGILKVIQVVLGIFCVGITAYYFTSQRYGGAVPWNNYYHLFSPELYFLLVTTTCLITTTLLLISCLISIASATILPKTVFEILYHGAMTILLFAASIAYIVRLNDDRARYFYQPNAEGYNPRLVAGILGCVNTILYGLSCFFAWRNYKGL